MQSPRSAPLLPVLEAELLAFPQSKTNDQIISDYWTAWKNCAKMTPRRNEGAAMASQNSKLGPDTLAKARAAGLDKAAAEFPDCVADAARAAALDLADVPVIEGTTEPWPSMRIRSRR